MKIDISKIKLEDDDYNVLADAVIEITGKNLYNHQLLELFVKFPESLIAKMWMYGSSDAEVIENMHKHLTEVLVAFKQ